MFWGQSLEYNKKIKKNVLSSFFIAIYFLYFDAIIEGKIIKAGAAQRCNLFRCQVL